MSTASGLTEILAAYSADSGRLALPDGVVERAKTGMIDSVATMLAGRGEAVVALASDICGPGDEASLLLGPGRSTARGAALVNATAAHVLDFDDVALLGHPSAVLMPAIFAEAERLDLSGADAVRAYVVGYEVWAELSGREQDPYHLKGWHPTSVFGTIAAAAAASSLNRASKDVARNALSIAASLASGLVANFGTMTKPFHAGRAAALGLEALDLAARGMTAAPDVLEHPAGFLHAISPAGRVDSVRPAAIGTGFRLADIGLSVKKYPICYATHRAIDGVLDLRRAHDLRPDQIAGVEVTISETQRSLLRHHRPDNALEAKFSIEFAVAAALVAGAVGFSELSDLFVQRPDVRALFDKVTIEISPIGSTVEVGLALEETVVITTRDGRRLDSGPIRYARGNAAAPLARADLDTKFLDCTAGVDWRDPVRLLENLWRLDELPSIRALVRDTET